MAVSAGMALLSTFSTGAAVAAGTGSFILGSALSHFLVTTALGAALNALTPKPSSSGGNRGYQVTQTGSALDHQIVYGEVKVAGARVFDTTTGVSNKHLHRVIAFTGHEIESFSEIYINDSKVTQLEADGNVLEVELPDGTLSGRYSGKVSINKHLGADDQEADLDLLDEVAEWTSNHRLRGLSYLYVKFSYDANVFPNGVPEVTAKIKGKKVYDPRTGTTAWSDNAALCMRDYLTSNTYGLGEDTVNVGDAKVISAADVCDQTNTPDGSTRYTCNGSFTTAVTPYDTLNNMLTSMGGLLWYAQGQWRMKPAYWTEPTLTLDENDLRSGLTVNTRHSRRDNYNKVKGTFRGEESNWQTTDYPEVSNSAFLVADNQQESVIDLTLPFTDTSSEARRIANVSLERNRQQLTISASFGMRAFQLQVGDNIKINNTRFGWSEKEFEVTSWTFGLVDGGDLQVQMILREVSESVFDDISDGVVYERDNTTLLSPFEIPSVGVTLEAVSITATEKLLNTLVVTVTSSQAERIDLIEVQIKKDASVDYSSLGSGSMGEGTIGSCVFSSADLARGVYDVRVRATNTFGIKGEWEYSLNFLVDSNSGAPSDVAGFQKSLSGGSLYLSWDAIPELDLSYYIIRHSPLQTGATWTNSNIVVNKVARPATTANLPARSGTFLIKAYDKDGNPSETETSLVVEESELRPFTNSLSQVEDPSFSGTYINTSLSSGELIITDQSAGEPTGSYEFTAYIDTGSTNLCRVTGFPVFTRISPSAGLWDDIPQNWDSWPNLWDGWTGSEANFADVSAVVYVSSTTDDPSASPTWGSWQLANGSEIYSRAFKFKVELNSLNMNVSPSVSTLKATVEY